MSTPNQSSTVVELYQGAEITFGGDAWVNATQMAKAFGKLPAHFTALASTKAFIAALQADSATIGNPILVRNGGSAPGTWMHPDLALEFARWLSPVFSIWCNRTIRRLLSGLDVGKMQLVLERALTLGEHHQHAAKVNSTIALSIGETVIDLKMQLAERDATIAEMQRRGAPTVWTHAMDAALRAHVAANQPVRLYGEKQGIPYHRVYRRTVQLGLELNGHPKRKSAPLQIMQGGKIA